RAGDDQSCPAHPQRQTGGGGLLARHLTQRPLPQTSALRPVALPRDREPTTRGVVPSRNPNHTAVRAAVQNREYSSKIVDLEFEAKLLSSALPLRIPAACPIHNLIRNRNATPCSSTKRRPCSASRAAPSTTAFARASCARCKYAGARSAS